MEGDFFPGPQEPVALGSNWGKRFLKFGVTLCICRCGDRHHGLSQTQTFSLQERGAHCKTKLGRNRKSWRPPAPAHSRVWSSRKGWGGAWAGGGQASFTARQDLLISRTNSDVLDLEHIYKIE